MVIASSFGNLELASYTDVLKAYTYSTSAGGEKTVGFIQALSFKDVRAKIFHSIEFFKIFIAVR